MSFVSNGGKFKLYTVLNGLIFATPTQPRISFEQVSGITAKKMIRINHYGLRISLQSNSRGMISIVFFFAVHYLVLCFSSSEGAIVVASRGKIEQSILPTLLQ
jgi:hypothetical protein